uniref:Uncharacterized protein n=1 Tax=Cajanus cajan TaxID=3821 RepID=A0A151S885_CAJCA|nr:hypothetical protein KK1_027161 [Cajanus cajan]
MVREAVQKKMISGFEVGENKIHINIQQFADDTLIVLELKLENVIVLKSILCYFEVVSGLRVNFHKSSLGALSIQNHMLDRFVGLLNCGKLVFPFSYLGIPVRVNARRKEVWQPLLQKMRKKLTPWRYRNLSIALNEIFFRGQVRGRGTLLGLGIRDVFNFNKALVCKCRWRILCERRALWVRVLRSKYGNFPRLYSLSSSKLVFVSDIGDWDQSEWKWNLPWRRECMVWEEQLII